MFSIGFVWTAVLWALVVMGCRMPTTESLLQPSSFLGETLPVSQHASAVWTMRKQKASDRRTRRKQRGEEDSAVGVVVARPTTKRTVTVSPMQGAAWKHKRLGDLKVQQPSRTTKQGRGRSRKRAAQYQVLQHYQNHFLDELTAEYQAEVCHSCRTGPSHILSDSSCKENEVFHRIEASLDDPIGLEGTGNMLLDMALERRGNLFSDQVYRLSKARDATTGVDSVRKETLSARPPLPTNHKFGNNDVIVVTLQPRGSGDFYSSRTLPTSETASSFEARILNQGPSYLDIVVSPNSIGVDDSTAYSRTDSTNRFRVDRFLSAVPYQRMVTALTQITTPVKASNSTFIKIDNILREAVLSTMALTDAKSPFYRNPEVCNLDQLSTQLGKPPMASSSKLAGQVLRFMKQPNNPAFPTFNGPQLSAIEAALTRRMTMIQGPPGTGKTTVAAAIAFGFVHQCRSISAQNSKVLCTAFSNVGADNMVESLLRLGLRVLRFGKPSAVAESLWPYTVEAAIDQDAEAQKALRHAATCRQPSAATTAAVKAAIEACSVATTKAMRAADVIVTTCTGAADPRLLAACGILASEASSAAGYTNEAERYSAPDGLSPLSFPFVVHDEACQSTEPASLIPLISSNSCRSLVLLGDPCQLPPTVISQESPSLSVSLMERLSATLPNPCIIPPADTTPKETSFLDTLPIKQAVSFAVSLKRDGRRSSSYRKVFGGALLLSVQYRMHPSIAALPSALFYGTLLSTPRLLDRKFPESMQQMPLLSGVPGMAVRVIDVGGPENERRGNPSTVGRASTVFEDPRTFWNEVEALKVMDVLRQVVASDDPSVSSIGVISPYQGQVQLIKTYIAKDSVIRKKLSSSRPISIEVKSVDGYQGRVRSKAEGRLYTEIFATSQERDLVIFSTVRSNKRRKIGFLNDWRRMNVALTRAKSGLVVIGDIAMLSSADPYWGAFKKWATGVRCVTDDTRQTDEESL